MKTLLILLLLSASMGYAHDMPKIIAALIQVESSGRAWVTNNQDVGILQINPVMVKEVNRIMRSNMYSLDDRLSPEKSRDMAMLFYTYWIKRWPVMSDRELMGRWNRPNGTAPEWYKDRCMRELNRETQ